MNYTLTEPEAKLTAKCLDELILLWDKHNIKHNITYYEIINIIVKLQGIERDDHDIVKLFNNI